MSPVTVDGRERPLRIARPWLAGFGMLLWVAAVLELHLDPTEWEAIVLLPAIGGVAIGLAASGRGAGAFFLALIGAEAMIVLGSGFPGDVHEYATTVAALSALAGLAIGLGIAQLGLLPLLSALVISMVGALVGLEIGNATCDNYERSTWECLDKSLTGGIVGLVLGLIVGARFALQLRRSRRRDSSNRR